MVTAPCSKRISTPDKYLVEFGAKFKVNNFWDDLLDKRHKQLVVLKMLDHICGNGKEWRGKIIGCQVCHITVQNPFTGMDLLC